MQKGHHLEFECLECQKPVLFSIFELDKSDTPIVCSSCRKQYLLEDSTLKRQLKKFEALCEQIVESEEILGNTAIGINVGDQHVKIPYKLLLTRLNTSLDLTIGDQKVSILFRLEPGIDLKNEE
jgi:DNA-directed RNA polymerase subunit RPC12/RpoP